jgi:hypothetical protein
LECWASLKQDILGIDVQNSNFRGVFLKGLGFTDLFLKQYAVEGNALVVYTSITIWPDLFF